MREDTLGSVRLRGRASSGTMPRSIPSCVRPSCGPSAMRETNAPLPLRPAAPARPWVNGGGGTDSRGCDIAVAVGPSRRRPAGGNMRSLFLCALCIWRLRWRRDVKARGQYQQTRAGGGTIVQPDHQEKKKADTEALSCQYRCATRKKVTSTTL